MSEPSNPPLFCGLNGEAWQDDNGVTQIRLEADCRVTLRDLFAGICAATLVDGYFDPNDGGPEDEHVEHRANISAEAYKTADALLKAREAGRE